MTNTLIAARLETISLKSALVVMVPIGMRSTTNGMDRSLEQIRSIACSLLVHYQSAVRARLERCYMGGLSF
jgi:hypothetical protein